MTNKMRDIRIEKITLNIGAGKDTQKLERGVKLLTTLAGKPPVKTFTKKRIPGWGLRPGLPIGCKITLRRDEAVKLLPRLLSAKEGKLKPGQFDDQGNVAFGIHEYIEIPDVNYDPDIGLLGLQVCVTLERPGFRIKKRKMLKKQIPKTHNISKDDAISYMKEQYKVDVEAQT